MVVKPASVRLQPPDRRGSLEVRPFPDTLTLKRPRKGSFFSQATGFLGWRFRGGTVRDEPVQAGAVETDSEGTHVHF